MRLLARTLLAGQGLRAAPPPARSCGGAAAGACLGWGRAAQPPRRPLSSWPGLETLFAAPGLRRFLEEQARGRAGPELGARIQRLWAKEQELRDTQELARGGERPPQSANGPAPSFWLRPPAPWDIARADAQPQVLGLSLLCVCACAVCVPVAASSGFVYTGS